MSKNAYLDVLPQAPGLVANSTGARQVYALDKWAQFERFLILGTSAGTYYASAKDLTEQNADVAKECIAADGLRAVALIVNVSTNGRAVKQSPGILALAYAASADDVNTRRAAWAALPEVCRIPTTLFEFATYVGKLRGKGRQYRNGFANWYTQKDTNDLAYQLVKYRQRDGWTNKDLIQLGHASASDPARAALFDWVFEKETNSEALPRIVEGYERAQRTSNVSELAQLVREYRLPWEALPTESLKSADVWSAIIEAGLPQGALLRQLPRLTNLGLLVPGSQLAAVTAQITDPERLRKARVHPFTVLNALSTYRSGRGTSQTWSPVTKVIDALDEAFYAAFGAVEPTGKSTLLAIDCSGSMSAQIAGTNLSARTAAAAMSLVTEAVEKDCLVTGFSAGSSGRSFRGRDAGIEPINISSKQRLDTVEKTMSRFNWGWTDCALPMLYAQAEGLKIDTFIIYTDNETWAGNVVPAQALRDYRRASGIDAKLVVVGTTSTGFSIADQNDGGMLDVVGFDTAAPNLISSFSNGEV